MIKIVLASNSRRRIELFQKLGLKFYKYSPKYKEENLFKTPEKTALEHAKRKAIEAADIHPEAIVVGCDTLGVHNGRILGKPKNKKEAFDMLSKLNGSTHEVLTGIYIINTKTGKTVGAVEKTEVKFTHLTNCQLRGYVNSGEGLDKAAAYAIQGLGSLLVEKIDGDYFNVVGLPLCRLGKMLKGMRINLLAKR